MIIPFFDTVILPEVDYQLGINEFSADEKEFLKKSDNLAVFLPISKKKPTPDIVMEDFFGMGVIAEVLDISESPLGTHLHAMTHEKVCLQSMVNENGYLTGDFSYVPEERDITADGEHELLDDLKQITISLSEHMQGGEVVQGYLKSCHSLMDYGAVFCQFLNMTPEEKYALLAVDRMSARGILIQEALLRFKGTVDMQVDINKRYNDAEGNLYKKAAIQKQLALLQDELAELDPDAVTEENEYVRKIAASGMPEEARTEVERALKRYMQAQPNDPERATLETYLDFVTDLKWTVDEIPPINLEKASKILDKDHYGLKKVKERILQQIAVMSLKQDEGGSILLFIGAPGTGKTSMGKSIAAALGRKYVRVSLGGVRDEAEIRGHRRTYIGAMPGRIMDGIKRSGAMNPVVVLDELDKLDQSYNGNPASALLEVLDPEQNNTFTDHYMNVPYDLSKVVFICTANSYDGIPQPLLDRMEVIQLPGYTPIDKLHIAKKHLIPRSLKEAGLEKKQLQISDGAIRRIIDDYTMEAGVRGLKKQLDILCRKTAAEIVMSRSVAENERKKAEKEARKAAKLASAAEAAGISADNDHLAPLSSESSASINYEANMSAEINSAANASTEKSAEKKITENSIIEKISVKEKDIPKYLGTKTAFHDRALKKCPSGVATGLAWTPVGGEILFIETTAMNGGGNVVLTGQLGDVMKESATIALSLLKSTFAGENLNLTDKDIHIHIPEGAVPKDGPSAGITMFTALVSLITGKSVSPTLAMTGEISLRGQVLPIGGLPEKLMAAQRAGIKKVLIPKENVEDLKDVAPEVVEVLEIVPVECVQDVIWQALEIKLPKSMALDFFSAPKAETTAE